MKRLLVLSVIFCASPASANVGFLVGETESGMNKICSYDVLGDIMTTNISSASMCPLSHNFRSDRVLQREQNPPQVKNRSDNISQSDRLSIENLVSIVCRNEERNLSITFFPSGGPITVYDGNRIWHRFQSVETNPQSVRGSEVTRLGYKNDSHGLTFKGIDLDRITGQVDLAEWSDYRVSNFFLGGSKKKRDTAFSFQGYCEQTSEKETSQKF
jgi:hypothetical protein